MATATGAWAGVEERGGTDGTRNGDPPRGNTLARVASALNHVAVQGRTFLSTMMFVVGDSPSVAGTTILHSYRYDVRNNNGRNVGYLVTYLPKDEAVNGNPAILDDDEGGATEIARTMARDAVAGIAWPTDLAHVEGNRA